MVGSKDRKMKKNSLTTEKGQSLVILAILLVVLLAFVALALDGGNTYVRRRQAQTAADAGALAGARQLCETASASEAILAAQDYAITRNGSDTADVTVFLDDGQVQVDTKITFDTFLAHLIGRPQMEVQATATAECQSPGAGQGIIPTAWACNPPINPPPPDEDGDCEQDTITPEELEEYLTNPPLPHCSPICPELYIIMNTDSTGDEYCAPDGTIDCDFDGDGENDLIAQGDRSWLNLDGGNPSDVEMRSWVEDGYAGELFIHTWFAGSPGAQTPVFNSVSTRIGDFLIIPVFDDLCGSEPSADGACSDSFHDQDTVVVGNGQSYFHVIGFSIFVPTCVDSGGQDVCPGHNEAVVNGMDHQEKTIEGYFIEGTVSGLGGGGSQGVDVGSYVLFLIK
jgi:hypothetical protein